MNRHILLICTMAICALGTLTAQTKKSAKPTEAQQPDPLQGSPKVITATKTVGQFWDLERSLADAFAKKDSGSLDKMLAEEFKVWRPNQTGNSIGREDWLAAGKDNPRPTRIAQMSVEIYPDLALVHFIGTGPVASGNKNEPKQYFVVDTWENHDGNWQLVTRYLAEIEPIKMPKRPTGKE
jgi:uncharacterized protein DUF4440